MWVAIIGSIGVGKNRIAEMLAAKEKFHIMPDIIDRGLQHKFEENPTKYGLRHQMSLLSKKFAQQQECAYRKANLDVCSVRLIEEVKLFSEFLHDREFIEKWELDIIEETYLAHSKACVPPDIVVYLKSDILNTHYRKELTENVCAFTDNEYIADLQKRYDALVERIAVPLVEVDMEGNFDTAWNSIEHGVASIKSARLHGETIWQTSLLR